MKNINVLNLQSDHIAIDKTEFMEATRKMPFVFDLLRAETFWQDRKIELMKSKKQSLFNKQGTALFSSLKMKTKFSPVVNVFLSDKDKIFIFKFEKKVMNSTSNQTHIKELVPKQIYMFEIEALFHEDIVLDMRDRIVLELTKIAERGMQISDNLINEIEGKMELKVRKVVEGNNKNERGAFQLEWTWWEVNDFDRLEKFSDDEVFEDEVIFKFIKKSHSHEE